MVTKHIRVLSQRQPAQATTTLMTLLTQLTILFDSILLRQVQQPWKTPFPTPVPGEPAA